MSGAIGFVGLGQMGMPMLANLAAKGRTIRAFDLSEPARVSAAALDNVQVAGTILELARETDVLILMLPDSTVVDRLLWNEGVADALRPGSLIVDMGSSHPMNTRANARRLAALGVGLVDAPVSGGVKRAVSATLSIMIGGETADVEKVRSILSDLGATLVHVGASGSGHAIKALNNFVSASGMAATCEALAAAERFGIDPSIANQVFNSSTGKNNTTENKVEAFMLNGRFDSGFAMSLMCKDLRTARSLMQAIDAKHAFADCCTRLWEAAESALPRGADHTALYRYVGRDAANDD
ncbi:MAG: NAD(P)-dependent oxidoreductase [Burkholderiaceae bacterium]|nr:NAD(P)-dependent oxidoreductase [Burkholderiaceae bacterium]